MRLIDADLLLEETEKSRNDNFHKEYKVASNHEMEHRHFIHLVNSQQTAYDIDKVVGELEKIKSRYSKLSCSVNDTNMMREFLAKEMSMALAIEIVKAGVRDV